MYSGVTSDVARFRGYAAQLATRELHLIRGQAAVRVVVVVVVRVPVVVDIAHIVRVVRVVVARAKDTELNLLYIIYLL